MRCDTPIYFQSITKGPYNSVTGNYSSDTVTEVEVYASVTETGIETLRLVYGSIQQGSLTIRIQNHYHNPFDQIRIGKKVYKVDKRLDLRTKQTFVLSEVQ